MTSKLTAMSQINLETLWALFLGQLEFNPPVLSPRFGRVGWIERLVLPESVGRQPFWRDPEEIHHIPDHRQRPPLAELPIVREPTRARQGHIVRVPIHPNDPVDPVGNVIGHIA